MKISQVKFTTSSRVDAKNGLIGWISCILNGTIYLDGLALRRTADGRRALSFPGKVDGHGHQQFYVRPLNDRTRREIEAQVFHALGLEEVARP
ncbi:MAG: hypothetical protein HY717_11200 [Planctomycetes bacterium]|nr:hypothetical protein [Planctomycetota bacterium]